MSVQDPVRFNFLFRFEAGGGPVYRYTDQAHIQSYGGEDYHPAEISHELPTYSSNASDAEVDVALKGDNELANLYLIQPPPYSVKLRIYEFDRDGETVTPHWTGYLVRPAWDFIKHIVTLKCKTAGFMLDRESVSDSLSALSRYSVFDPRSGVDVEAFKTAVTVTAINELRDELVVAGLTEIDGWFKGGVIVAPDLDERTILDNDTVGADKVLYLAGGFSSLSLDVGDAADLYAGDDLTHAQWVNKWSAGQNFGGWPFTPNADPVVTGVK